jgi:predicted SnoaL-like aldol condensation-catalyzing enzyme
MSERSTRELAERYLAMIREGRFRDAIEAFVDPVKYIQHNPGYLDGREHTLRGIDDMLATKHGFTLEPKRMLVDGDMVCVHFHLKINPNEPGFAVADFWRVENGKIVEHWDVVQPVPAESINRRGMF